MDPEKKASKRNGEEANLVRGVQRCLAGVHQCTMGKQVYTRAVWVVRCTPVHYGQVYTKAL